MKLTQLAAFARSLGRDLGSVEKKMHLPGRVVRKWNREGLDTIASGLRRDRVPIW